MVGISLSRSRSKRSTSTHEQIVQAAAELLSTKGYEATSLEEVAVQAGVTKGTVYYHFDSKEALYWAVISPSVEKRVGAAEAIAAAGESPREALIQILMEQTSGARLSGEKYMYYQEMLPLNDEMRRAIRQRERDYEAVVAGIIVRGQKAGQMIAGDPKMLALIFIGAGARTARWYDPNGRVGPDEFWRMTASLLLNGMLTEDWKPATPEKPGGATKAARNGAAAKRRN